MHGFLIKITSLKRIILIDTQPPGNYANVHAEQVYCSDTNRIVSKDTGTKREQKRHIVSKNTREQGASKGAIKLVNASYDR